MIFRRCFSALSLALLFAVTGCAQPAPPASQANQTTTNASTSAAPAKHDHCGYLETPGSLDEKLEGATMQLEIDKENGYVSHADYYVLGCVYLAKKDDDQAFKYFEASYPSQLSNDDGDYRLGLIYWHRRNYNMTIAYITEAIRGDANYAPMYDIRGLAYAKNDSIALAHADLAKAVEMDPRNPTYQADRCRILAKYGESDQAMSFCARAIDLAPQDSHTLAMRGYANLLSGKLAPAVADYTEALRQDDTNAEALYGRGVAYGRQGKRVLAAIDLAKARRLVPDIDTFMAEDKVVPPAGM